VTFEGTLLRPIDDAKWVLVRTGELPVPLLTRTLTAEEPYLRSIALELLGRIGPPARVAAPAVLPLLGDPKTALYAVRALGEIGDPAPVARLRPLLTNVDIELRKAAAEALGMLRDEPSREALRARLRDGNEAMDVRVSAAFGLRCFGDDTEAEAFLAERETKQDYHAPMLRLLRDRLAARAEPAATADQRR
jgi:HEAT repeat protein